mmetsp:Transcript_45130/g.134773  ORF Transcript_45130/g.134773 Transcript_45130/m.134773 type:complete len:219 (+) Transcript_45130:702-1358(+)
MERLADHVELAQSVGPLLLRRQRLELGVVLVAALADVGDPAVDEALRLGRQGQRTLYCAAAIVPAADDDLDLERRDGILEARHHVHVGMHGLVAHVALHKDLAGRQAHDLVSRHTRVGTANPQVFRRLLRLQAAEVRRILGHLLSRPCLVIGQQAVELGLEAGGAAAAAVAGVGGVVRGVGRGGCGRRGRHRCCLADAAGKVLLLALLGQRCRRGSGA